jgi:predicted O-methyltransferase YrrM
LKGPGDRAYFFATPKERYTDRHMNPVLAEMLAAGAVVAPDGSTVPLDYNISPDEGAAIQRLIREIKPRVTLEVGCAFGVSTLFICEALAEVGGERHIVIDPFQEQGWNGLGLFSARRAGFGDLIEFHDEPSYLALPSLVNAQRRVDFALIDGWHTFDYVMVDFFYVDLLLTVGGIAVLDDTRFYPAIRKVARYIATHRRYAPIDNGVRRALSAKRRALNAVSALLGAPPLRAATKYILRPDILRPDSALGLPGGNFIAFRKIADDPLGDGSNGTRRWDQHVDF